MADQSDELLVILREWDTEIPMQSLRSQFRVSQMMAPRLVIVETSVDHLDQIRRIPGVVAVTAFEVPDAISRALTESEKLFMAAWKRRRLAHPKIRHGDGLSWDADGFEAPDRK